MAFVLYQRIVDGILLQKFTLSGEWDRCCYRSLYQEIVVVTGIYIRKWSGCCYRNLYQDSGIVVVTVVYTRRVG